MGARSTRSLKGHPYWNDSTHEWASTLEPTPCNEPRAAQYVLLRVMLRLWATCPVGSMPCTHAEPLPDQLSAELLLLSMWLRSMHSFDKDFDIDMDDSDDTMFKMHEHFMGDASKTS